MWGHLIASMNHSQIAPVQQLDSGCWCLPGAGARPGWARLWGDEGHCSLLSGKLAGVLARPLAPPFSTACCPSPSPHRTEFTHCYLAVLSPWRPGGGAEAAPPDLATPTPCYLAQQPPPAPCSLSLLLFPASSRACFVCSCLFSCLSLSVFSL